MMTTTGTAPMYSAMFPLLRALRMEPLLLPLAEFPRPRPGRSSHDVAVMVERIDALDRSVALPASLRIPPHSVGVARSPRRHGVKPLRARPDAGRRATRRRSSDSPWAKSPPGWVPDGRYLDQKGQLYLRLPGADVIHPPPARKHAIARPRRASGRAIRLGPFKLRYRVRVCFSMAACGLIVSSTGHPKSSEG